MQIFIAIQHTYDGIEFALFRGQTVLAHHTMSKFHASSVLIPNLDRALAAHNLSLSDIAFIAANYGPGPFTTLRVVIATINGIAFARNIPLVGVDGLKAFIEEYKNQSYDLSEEARKVKADRTICILNAFNHDVYYGYYDDTNTLITGSANGELFLRDMAVKFAAAHKIQFLGNATANLCPIIDTLFADRAIIPQPIPDTCSVQQIGLMGYEQWQRNENVTNQLLPQYLKLQQFTQCS